MRDMLVVELKRDEWMLYTPFDTDTLIELWDLASYSNGILHFSEEEYDKCYKRTTGDDFYGIRIRIEEELNDPTDEDSGLHEEFHFSFEEDPASEMFGTFGHGHIEEVCDLRQWARKWFKTEPWYKEYYNDTWYEDR